MMGSCTETARQAHEIKARKLLKEAMQYSSNELLSKPIAVINSPCSSSETIEPTGHYECENLPYDSKFNNSSNRQSPEVLNFLEVIASTKPQPLRPDSASGFRTRRKYAADGSAYPMLLPDSPQPDVPSTQDVVLGPRTATTAQRGRSAAPAPARHGRRPASLSPARGSRRAPPEPRHALRASSRRPASICTDGCDLTATSAASSPVLCSPNGEPAGGRPPLACATGGRPEAMEKRLGRCPPLRRHSLLEGMIGFAAALDDFQSSSARHLPSPAPSPPLPAMSPLQPAGAGRAAPVMPSRRRPA